MRRSSIASLASRKVFALLPFQEEHGASTTTRGGRGHARARRRGRGRPRPR